MSKRMALFTILLYLAFAFMTWQWNPEKWDELWRVCFVVTDLSIYVSQLIYRETAIW